MFGAGTVQWAWGLDADTPRRRAGRPEMQQATVNLFADMGVQPATRQSGLVPASASTDTTEPTATMTSPADARPPTGAASRERTATDAGGGVVGGGRGLDRRRRDLAPRQRTSAWTYTWTPGCAAPSRRSRAPRTTAAT